MVLLELQGVGGLKAKVSIYTELTSSCVRQDFKRTSRRGVAGGRGGELWLVCEVNKKGIEQHQLVFINSLRALGVGMPAVWGYTVDVLVAKRTHRCFLHPHHK